MVESKTGKEHSYTGIKQTLSEPIAMILANGESITYKYANKVQRCSKHHESNNENECTDIIDDDIDNDIDNNTDNNTDILTASEVTLTI